MNNQVEKTLETNIACICGELLSQCQFSHRTYGEDFYIFKVGISRNSGYEDQIIVMASERILRDISIVPYERVSVYGQIRTYNEEVDGRNRLNIVVFAREIDQVNVDENLNDVYIEGFLCKKPVKRTSPLGRKICDMMIAVNRMYNKSDYIPCIAWGRNAIYAGTLQVGEKIIIKGRLQSRQYRKKDENGELIFRVAYEVSILHLETLPNDVI